MQPTITQPEMMNGEAFTEPPAPHVVEAVRRVMRDLPGIGKDQHADPAQGGYAYRGLEAITKEAQGLCARHGVIFVPSVIGPPEVVNITVNSKPWTDTRISVLYTVYGPGGPADKITVGPIFAIGRDNSDKGANKCMSQAFKYALLQLFMIADAKDDADQGSPEADQPVPPEVTERKQANRALLARTEQLRQEVRVAYITWRDAERKNGRIVYESFGGYDLTSCAAIHAKLDELEAAVPDPVVEAPRSGLDPTDCTGCGQPVAEGEGVETDDGRLWHEEHAPKAQLGDWVADAIAEDGAAPQAPVTAAESPGEPSQEPEGSPAPELPADGPTEALTLDAPTWPKGVSPERVLKIETRVKRYALSKVREQLNAAGRQSSGTPIEVRQRLVDHLVGQLARADQAAR